MWEELTNALAWFKAAPARWIESAKQDLGAAAEWLWEVLQGDFAEEQSTAQVVTGTVISMIPFVDQICDVRDIVANCGKIKQDTSNAFAWVALVLTLIGLFPCLGSLAKGCLKIPFNYARKYAFKATAKATAKVLEHDLWKATKPYIEQSIAKLNDYLGDPAVRKTLAALKIDNVFKYLADKVRELKGALNASALMKVFNEGIDALEGFVNLIKKWGNEALQTKAGQALKAVKEVRDEANKRFAELLAPMQRWLDNLARRLEVEADMNYRAATNALNPHAYRRPQLADDVAEFGKAKPSWVDEGTKLKYKAMRTPPHSPDWPDLNPPRGSPLFDAYKTFHDATPVTIQPGEKLYRIVDPGSFDNRMCWMRESEFLAIKDKADWRRRFAVWRHWNRNGEFVTYTVPPGPGLRAWEGKAASQELEKTKYSLEGGGVQIVLDPKDLDKSFVGKRQPTNWGYTDFAGETDQFLGLPMLTNNWS
jgi:soluble cytochrome b562